MDQNVILPEGGLWLPTTVDVEIEYDTPYRSALFRQFVDGESDPLEPTAGGPAYPGNLLDETEHLDVLLDSPMLMTQGPMLPEAQFPVGGWDLAGASLDAALLQQELELSLLAWG